MLRAIEETHNEDNNATNVNRHMVLYSSLQCNESHSVWGMSEVVANLRKFYGFQLYSFPPKDPISIKTTTPVLANLSSARSVTWCGVEVVFTKTLPAVLPSEADHVVSRRRTFTREREFASRGISTSLGLLFTELYRRAGLR